MTSLGPRGVGFRRATPAVLAQRRALAKRVADEMELAGLACQPGGSVTRGVVIEVDPGDDAAGGVFVRWNVSEALAEQTGAAILAEQLEHPALARASRIEEHMRAALAAILTDAGFFVVESDDDIRVTTLRVHDSAPSAATSG